MSKSMLKLAALLLPVVFSVGCATKPAAPYDYAAFEASNPHSILVLPPVNNSPDVKATYGVYAQVSRPLAEAGYYVLPVAVVNETFKQNGLTDANDIHNVDPKKLQQIFGADAALHVTITQYGSTYNIISSVVTVAAEAKLVDLRTGALLWENKVIVVDKGDQGSVANPVALLVKAALTQILNSALDKTYIVAGMANQQLLSGGQVNGLLYGPRSPLFKGRRKAFPAAGLSSAPQPAVSLAPVTVLAVPQTTTAPVAAPATTTLPAPAPAPVVAAPVMPVAPARIAPALTPAPPEVMAAPAVVTMAPPAALSGPEQRYADALRRAQAQHAALDPASNWYRRELLEWVMDRKAEFIDAGHAPEVALQRAVALIDSK